MSPSLSLIQRFKRSRFIRGEAPNQGPVKLTHRRIFILPTKRGLVFILFICLLVLLAFVYNNNLAYLLSFLMASVFIVSILHSFNALAGLTISIGKHPPVFAGESAAFAIHIDNPAAYKRINLQITSPDTMMMQTDIANQDSKTLALSVPTQTRGQKWLSTVTFVSYFPLGLMRAWSPINFKSSVLVYPKPADSLIPFPESYSPKHQQGQTKGGNDEFYQCQDYQKGDPIRQIHWKAFAKHQALLSKKYGGESSAEIWLDLMMAPGHNLEEKLSQLCRWVNDASSANLNYGLRMPSINFDPDNSYGHRLKCLETLALFELR